VFELTYLIKGFIVGVSIAAPVGPIGILCIKRTLLFGLHAGILTGFGAASADLFFSIIAGFGLTAMTTLIEAKKTLFEIAGGIILLIMSLKAFMQRSNSEQESHAETLKGDHYIKGYFTAFFLTLTNPITILGVMALFAGLGITHETTNKTQMLTLVLGVFLGSAAWFIGLSSAIGFLLHNRLNSKQLSYINIFSAGLFLIFGIFVLVRAFA
jgi:threonine/homoserine/homoserine lactone efflux protein